MKVTIRDRDVLGSIPPGNLDTYLRIRGWQEVRKEENRFSIWHKQDDRDTFEILLPLNSEFRDYPIRVAEMLSNLEIVEERSQLDILYDIASQ